MLNSSTWKSGATVLVALGLVTGTVAPIVMISTPAYSQSSFPDVPPNYWATPFISELAARGVIAGFEDGTFRPEQPVTRAQFAAMINKAFNQPRVREPISFVDVPTNNYWAAAPIQKAYTMGFMAGYPGNVFRPDENIPRSQVLVSLTSGLNYAPTGSVDSTLGLFADGNTVLQYARNGVAAATQRRMVVNFPDIRLIRPNQVATRAEVAAFLFQSLVSTGQVAAIQSPYIFGDLPPVGIKIPAGTSIPVRYEGADKILLAKNEPPIPFRMKVAQNVVTSQGQVLIPAGSDVVGQLKTTPSGAQFTAGEIVLPDGKRLPVNAASSLITKTETITKSPSTTKIVASTLLGAGAAAGISAVTGDRTIKAYEVLPGAVVGAGLTLLFPDRIDLYAINPSTDLLLTLNSDLSLP
ncbi:S-layer homology domain-containing protein [Phormidium sp. CLA17]|uniref:S-layer homology domain-containing protein n=1 Tax=Leptolyngbya sp. Cla-17 TaxID=2803751 RepID=UPI001491E8B7|nr:S-layer homology domain-containing protein [Leptolyngbya sp. Cla-17]MBM0741504.1 S-layer homology domain-containing protein [Leptolyngbya sp. Cla-17]